MPASETLGPFLSRNWIGSVDSYDNADIVMIGLPFDSFGYRIATVTISINN